MSEKINQGKKIIHELSNLLEELEDAQAAEILFDTFNELLPSILNPTNVTHFPSIAEYLLANKNRWKFISQLIFYLKQNYSFRGSSDEGKAGFVSPTELQWFEDGVMFLDGEKRGAGTLGLYKGGGKIYYAIYGRDAQGGEILGPEDFEFVELEMIKARKRQISLDKISRLDEPIIKLKELLEKQINDETKYQELLHNYPWILGMQYTKIQRHEALDDKHIPDFTGVRAKDKHRDIIEIKPPFARLFTKGDNRFRKEFHDYWDQAVSYLDFANHHRSYLLEKGLRFDNPKCYLVLGYNLSTKQKKKIDIKRRNSPIELLTYNDLLAYMENTVQVLRGLKNLESDK